MLVIVLGRNNIHAYHKNVNISLPALTNCILEACNFYRLLTLFNNCTCVVERLTKKSFPSFVH